jgi:hypothetical protein
MAGFFITFREWIFINYSLQSFDIKASVSQRNRDKLLLNLKLLNEVIAQVRFYQNLLKG